MPTMCRWLRRRWRSEWTSRGVREKPTTSARKYQLGDCTPSGFLQCAHRPHRLGRPDPRCVCTRRYRADPVSRCINRSREAARVMRSRACRRTLYSCLPITENKEIRDEVGYSSVPGRKKLPTSTGFLHFANDRSREQR